MTDGSNGDLVRELRSAAEWHRIEHDGNLDDSTAPLRAATALETQAERISVLERALEPFAQFGADNTDEEGWGGLRCERERICVWFGPSDFRRARTALKGAR